MSKHCLIAGIVSLLLTGCALNQTAQGPQSLHFAVCSKEGSGFEDKAFKEWKDYYHDNISKAIESHINRLGSVISSPLQCTAKDYSSLLPASEELRAIAKDLPAWSERPEALKKLGELELGIVLLEFLRVYECSLNERREWLQVYITNEAESRMLRGDFNEQQASEEQLILRELATARPALERTLVVLSGMDRMQPLSLDIECIKRLSLDVRNGIGLAADVSACLPRALDAHNSLRDLPDE